ncbi:SusC/RagA family TonB-linked outer membrane protein [Chitinophagaceae bacterium LB-8]|uniref:SusC/RagA family TonB-linked outer membrane protein n=1 Tax=Paraflavisolibacter caeni TaxID=2982496 RepID=A0A9X2XPE0_9BACT|nr:SusC/RagA family TonB-linked outer membrane protein [Paraflavisolibacter caeni]MCU7551083.1 SusC/RagA family TonB-linked outer membrane protein [Paraflavisolibacter caeni]
MPKHYNCYQQKTKSWRNPTKALLRLLMVFFAILTTQFAFSQFKGKVTDEKGSPMAGVSVIVKNGKGVVTDANGEFNVNVKKGTSITFSFVGFESQQVVTGTSEFISVKLKQAIQNMDDVVVTALGIKREKKSLGYAMSTIKAAELVKTGNTVNPLMSLYGKAAGLRISSTNTGPTGGTVINIRNTVSLNEGSRTRPLFVVDGIPIYDQNTSTSLNDRDGRDRGTGINDINAEDIESIEILKGAKAAVLYGYSGANGVVLINTKNGSAQKGVGIDFSTNYTWDNAAFQPEFQNIYGSGGNVAYNSIDPAMTDAKGFKYEMINGVKTPVFFNLSGSFGPKMDGTQIYWYDKQMRPYTPQPNNYKDLFNQGHLQTTNVAVSNGGAWGNVRLAYSNKKYESVMVGASQQNHIVSFSGNFNPSKFLKVGFNSNYYYTDNHNAPFRMQSFATYGIARDLKTDLLRDNITDESGNYSYFAMNKDIANRATGTISGTLGGDYFWSQTRNTYDELRHHFIQSINATATFTDWLNLSVLGGFDMTRINDIVKKNFTRPLYMDNKQGYFSELNNQHNSIYGQALLNVNRNLNRDFTLTGSVGTAYRYNMDRSLSGLTQNFAIENLFKFNNSTDVAPYTGGGDEGDDVTYSALASANLSYRNFLFLELQGRNDWTSILPPSNNSYFYPGASVSWIASEQLRLPSVIKFAKVRASIADVGRPGERYFGNNTYGNGMYGAIPFATASTTLPPGFVKDGQLILNLQPEKKRETEFGFETKFFEHNRLGVDVSFYQSYMYNQIISLSVPQSSGTAAIRTNAGGIRNRGVELQITGTPVLTKKFAWNTSLNFSMNKNKIMELAQGVKILPLWGINGAFSRAVVGGEYGEIYIAPWKRNKDGKYIVGSDGIRIFDKDNLKKVGVTLPKVLGGFNSNLKYSGFSLDMDFDWQFGGTLISQTNMFGRGNGTFKSSLQYRDEANGGLPYYVNNSGAYVLLNSHTAAVPSDSKYGFIFHDGVIVDGVKEDGTTKNDKLISAQAYYEKTYWQGGMDITEDVIYKSDYISLRRVTLSYDLPSKLVRKVGIQKANLGLFAFNLAYLYKALPNVTPESTGGTNEYMESTNLPGVRSIGCQLKLSF